MECVLVMKQLCGYFHADVTHYITHEHVVPLTLERTVMSTELKHLRESLAPEIQAAGLMDL